MNARLTVLTMMFVPLFVQANEKGISKELAIVKACSEATDFEKLRKYDLSTIGDVKVDRIGKKLKVTFHFEAEMDGGHPVACVSNHWFNNDGTPAACEPCALNTSITKPLCACTTMPHCVYKDRKPYIDSNADVNGDVVDSNSVVSE